MEITPDTIRSGTGASEENTAKYADALIVAMERFEINTPQRVAAFLATLAIESDHLTADEERLFYRTADRLAAIFPSTFPNAAAAQSCVGNPQALSQTRYQGFHGRGLIQLTWKENYQAASKDLGVDYVGNPALLCTPEHAALSAAWFWSSKGCNELADADDMRRITRVVNGAAMLKLAERIEQYETNKTMIA